MTITLETLLYLIGNAFHIYLVMYALHLLFQKCRVPVYVLWIYGILYYTVNSGAYLLWDNPLINIADNLLFLYGVCFFYKAKWQQYCFFPISVFIASALTEGIIALIPVLNAETISGLKNGTTLLLQAFLLFFIVLIFRKMKKHDVTLPIQFWCMLFAVPLLSLITLFALVVEYTIRPAQLIIVYVALIAINILEFWLYDQISAYYQLRQEYHIAKEQVDAYSTQLSLQKQSEQKVHSIRHDMNKKLLLLRDSLSRQDYEQTEQQLSSILGEVGKALPNAFSCNPAVNSMLNLKKEAAVQKGIDFSCQVDVQQNTPFDEMDLCVILFNLLDNAIEAQDGVTERKYIHVKMVQEDNTWLISIRNSCKPGLKVTNGELPRSTKGDDFSHGYGIKNVIENIKKYDGEYQIYADDGYFLFTALLNFPTME